MPTEQISKLQDAHTITYVAQIQINYKLWNFKRNNSTGNIGLIMHSTTLPMT